LFSEFEDLRPADEDHDFLDRAHFMNDCQEILGESQWNFWEGLIEDLLQDVVEGSGESVCVFLENGLIVLDVGDHLVDVDECVHAFAEVAELELRDVREELVALLLLERVVLVEQQVVLVREAPRVLLEDFPHRLVVLVSVVYPVLHLLLLDYLVRFGVLRRRSELWGLLHH